MEETTKNNFLGVEKVGKLMRMFAIPCVLSLIIQSLYNLVDQIYIGNCATLGAAGNGGKGVDPVKYKSALLLGSSARFVLCNLPIALILLSIFANIILWKEIITILLLSALDRLARLAQRSCQRMAFPFW